MAGIFQAFRSSAMPKRLLRYALARFDIFEDDALDLENLDLGLGRNNTFEFRDVGIKVEKLDKYLSLPNFTIKKAKVLRLRLILPLDFYSSPIRLEVDGVDIRLKVSSPDKTARPEKGEAGRAAADIVPTAADLAQSFLETQPSRERKELEDALAAETQDLGASVSVSEDGSDEDLAYGVGQGLSLPAFMTDFLQGVADRAQVKIQGVNVQLDVEIPGDTNSTTPDIVTFQVSLEKLDVEGVTTQVQGEDSGHKIRPKEGKRHILLDSIRAYLITEANVFSTFAKSPSIPSSVASRSPVLTERKPPTQNGSFMPASFYAGSLADSDDNIVESQYPLRDSEDAFNIPYEMDKPGEHAAQEGIEHGSPLSTPRASVYQDLPTHYDESPSHSAVVGVEPLEWSVPQREAQSEPALQSQMRFGHGPLFQQQSLDESATSSSSASDDSGTHNNDDLAKSHLFSHEDAESMYMSAFSQVESQRTTSSAMPGAWDSNPPSPENPPQRRRPVTPSAPSIPNNGSDIEMPAKEESGRDQISEEEPQLESSTPTQKVAQSKIGLTEETKETDVPDRPRNCAPSAPPEEVSTPKSATRLVKEIMSLEAISVYVPLTHKHIQVVAADESPVLGRSVSRNVPGSFSVYSTTTAGTTSTSPEQKAAVPGPLDSQSKDDRSVEVILAPLEARFDASVGYLLAKTMSRMIEAVKSRRVPAGKGMDPSRSAPEANTALPEIRLVAEKITLLFLEKMAGVADTAERVLNSGTMNFEPDTLLRVGLENVAATCSQIGTLSKTSVSIEKFHFGYADSDILSFDQAIQMRASVRDVFPAAGADISLKLSMSNDSTKCEVNTLPLRIHLDLQRLDETFSWFGGLSSFLQMSSSMTSSTSPVARSPAKPTKPRGVRFDTPIKPDDDSVSSQNKADLRIGGLQLELVGKQCGMALTTSAVKIVSREEGIGVGISRIHLAGPYQKRFTGESPINVEVTNTRVEFLFTPNNTDLDRLLRLITPSNMKFDERADEIMVDTLLRQRTKGSVLRLTFENFKASVIKLQQLDCLPGLGEELSRLGTVAKYLPEDDRPGLLTLGLVRNLDVFVDVGGRFGHVNTNMTNFELAHITVPSLLAFATNSITAKRNNFEELVGSSNALGSNFETEKTPVLMVRMIGDEMEPVIKVKMRKLNFEYRVPTVMDILGLTSEATPQDFEASLAASVANLGEQAHTALVAPPVRDSSTAKDSMRKPTVVDIGFLDCMIGLNPLGLTSKLSVILTNAHVEVGVPKDANVNAVVRLHKVAILLVDDVSLLDPKSHPGPSRRRESDAQIQSELVSTLCSRGYVNICQISSARATIQVTADEEGESHVDVELRDDLLVLETCADSTHTLIALANALTPPTPPSKEVKYKTQVIPMQDMLASITADAFGKAEGDYDFDDDFAIAQELAGDDSSSFEEDVAGPSGLGIESQFYQPDPVVEEALFDATSSSVVSNRTMTQDTNDGVLLTNFNTLAANSDDGSEFEIQENYFGTNSVLEGTAHRWDSSKNTYDQSNSAKVHKSPLKVCVRDVHVIWNLFDGYDWQHTRDAITKTVQEVELKAHERRTRHRRSRDEQDFEEEEEVIGDFLFNSIYIGIPTTHDPRGLTSAINQQIEPGSETESIATSAVTATTTRTAGGFQSRAKKLRLNRSRHHKITFELQGVNVDLVSFAPNSGETLNSIDVRVSELVVFDHVPTSTWKKFATYDRDVGERQLGKNMVHLEILNVKPVQSLAASEIVLKATILPLRLHVDQDALDFITRFFEFKDESQPVHASPSDQPFIQRAEIMSIPVRLDFKPKRVDYAGLRSGHTTEFMNFLILDSARLTLRHAIVYGARGFDRLGKTLNDSWMPDVKRHQLPGVLAGLAPVRSLVNVGSGFKDLVEIPIREYKKDGRIVRSIGKGAAAFARTTGTEIVKLGAKMAIGTQYVLQGAEGMLVQNPSGSDVSGEPSIQSGWEDEDVEPEERKRISLYADQPTGVMQGLRHAYSSLSRDLNVARDAIIAVPAEVMESQSAQGAAKAVLRRAPTIIFRPAIGATKAMGQALLGATNAMDPQNLRRMEDKYKPGPGRQ